MSSVIPPGGAVVPAEGQSEFPIVIDETGTAPDAVRSGATSAGRIWRRLLRSKVAMVALGFIVFLILVAILAPVIAPHDPDEQNLLNTLEGSSRAHWLGTDDLGRDTLSRLIYATRLSLRATIQTMILAFMVAVPLGLIAGYFRGWADSVISRTVDAMFTFPPIVLAISIVALLGPNLTNLSIAIAIVFIPGLIRLVRGQVLAVREEVFIEASRSVGAGPMRILRTHIFPNVASPVIVSVSQSFGYILLTEAGLTFLGLGEPAPAASWGGMLQRAYQSVFTAPWQIVWPGLAIALTVLAFNLLGDGLRDALGRDNVRVSRRSILKANRAHRDRALARQAFQDDVESLVGEIPPAEAVLEVEHLAVEFITPNGWLRVVDDVSFTVHPGETVGLVGESGSGKSVSVLSVIGLLPQGQGRVAGGSVRYAGRELLGIDASAMRAIQGSEIAMIFQEPMTSLNPAFTIGNQIVESVRAHGKVGKKAAWTRAVELLDLVGIPDAAQRVNEYPHNFSGGMRQRAMIAMALACGPKILIADEPTTALDVTIQAQILDLLRQLQRDLGMAIVFVTHDLGVVADICDHVAVLYGGQTAEQAPVNELFAHPRHPYSAALMASMPQAAPPGEHLRVIPGTVPRPDDMPQGCRFHPRCEYAQDQCAAAPVPITAFGSGTMVRCVRHEELALTAPALHLAGDGETEPLTDKEPLLRVVGLRQEFPIRKGITRRTVGQVKAVDGIDFDIAAGETVGLVGESGSGKSTTGRALLRLIEPTAGEIDFAGDDITALKGKDLRTVRASMQMVFQDPYSSLDPKRTIAESIGEPFAVHAKLSRKERDAEVERLLETVGMGRHLAHRYPHEFSGGQRQRIAIARALALNPKLLVCDEPVSSLDVSTQSQVINLLIDLQREFGLAYLFIAHDLSVVSRISDRIAVMYLGRIVEIGPASEVVASPRHPYTLALLSAIPVPDPVEQRRRRRVVLRGDIPSPANPPSGCRFHTRCVYAFEVCSDVDPPAYRTSDGTTVYCHLHTDGPVLAGQPVTLLPTPRDETVES